MTSHVQFFWVSVDQAGFLSSFCSTCLCLRFTIHFSYNVGTVMIIKDFSALSVPPNKVLIALCEVLEASVTPTIEGILRALWIF